MAVSVKVNCVIKKSVDENVDTIQWIGSSDFTNFTQVELPKHWKVSKARMARVIDLFSEVFHDFQGFKRLLTKMDNVLTRVQKGS